MQEDNKYKISILIISYNQENEIVHALDSILRQKDYGLHEIVVCDDCSKDKTWSIVESYVNKYKGVIRAYRNEPNLGIYDNEQKLLSLRGDADFFSELAGDDELCDGWFAKIQSFVNQNRIDPEISPVAIYSDWKIVSPSGNEKVFYQDKVMSSENLVSLAIRGVISPRSVMMTKALVDKFIPVDTSHGLPTAEMRYDLQIPYFAERAYYCPHIASIYYSELGISTTTHSLEYDKLRLYNYETIEEIFNFDIKDSYLIKSRRYSILFLLNKSLANYLKSIYFYIKSIKKICRPSYMQVYRIYRSLLCTGLFRNR